MALMASMSAGWPNRCTGTIALVRGGDGRFDGGRVDVGRVGQAIDDDRGAAHVSHGFGRGHEGVRRDDDLVAGADAGGLVGQEERVGAGAHAHRLGAGAELGERGLEVAHLGTHDVGGPIDDVGEGRLVLREQLTVPESSGRQTVRVPRQPPLWYEH